VDDDSRGFVSAFTRAVRPGDEPGQSTRRMLMLSPASVIAGHAFTVAGGSVTVALLDVGLNGTPATHGAHVAAADIRLTCQQG
jgi:hypothetical protein